MLLMIDNYDSFTYNLVQAFGKLGAEIEVYRNDEISLADLQTRRPERIVISPGPGTPDDGGISLDVLAQISSGIPTLGVCLGHQCIGQAFGGQVVRAPHLMHGKTSEIFHRNHPLFTGVPSPFIATRYHSLIVEEPMPTDLSVIAFTEAGEVMGLKHKHLPIVGVQFHPESILTTYGPRILQNFLEGRF
ncbi:MAG: aminodeoxychorismate/anthranilate synthase component II [Anaerolineae bacterium]|nr:aminodeoxychorismate/anthranilate synthase component II [Anaerolineae bacterium]